MFLESCRFGLASGGVMLAVLMWLFQLHQKPLSSEEVVATALVAMPLGFVCVFIAWIAARASVGMLRGTGGFVTGGVAWILMLVAVASIDQASGMNLLKVLSGELLPFMLFPLFGMVFAELRYRAPATR